MDEKELERLHELERSLQPEENTHPNLKWVILASLAIAVIAWTFVYHWSVWVAVLGVAVLVAIMIAATRRRPPVAPVELTAQERDRVRRVMDEHGLRAAVALVRALYPEEHPAAAVAAVNLIARRP
ncbi:hypothetical protein KRX51_02320 [Corynebacterium sp. TAE3-ERU12]|uniref:hypothetical protein n=1 Tax=Corynebacterium sp. TAE3-ERU12 TaxID=2849491 RepID=UPI001C43C224|nr:hypothetical protein [Corynebacterium sp. TAE3-ERU12]MBV7294755.1 hypothetical protein [Corynebacterium sp. TAE3-ERU12]